MSFSLLEETKSHPSADHDVARVDPHDERNN